ncbi:MAG: NAD(P)H nitroreductase [Colwellia sp.]|nr:NAD(P)H nitroreductase [Colwellia sp.]
MNNIDLLLNRRSNAALTFPAPDHDALDKILTAGMRVPDHGNIKPWHFTVMQDKGLDQLSDIFLKAGQADGVNEEKKQRMIKMPFRAPLIILISTRYCQHPKVPKQEQLIAAGCCVHAMQMAAFGLGYGAIWRTGELSYHALVKAELNIREDDEIVGFLYIGTENRQLPEKATTPYQDYVTLLE